MALSTRSQSQGPMPQALGRLSEQERESLRTFISSLLTELGEAELNKMSSQWGLRKQEAVEVANYFKPEANPRGDLATLNPNTTRITIKNNTFDIGRKLGNGKYAEVRRGVNVETRKRYAIKFLFVDCPRAQVRILRNQMREELRAFKKISHRNIVRLHSYDLRSVISTNGAAPRPCMIQVQELCSKGELYDYVQYNGKFNEKLTRTICRQFFKGLRACHQVGIAHRDLKPDNILLDSNYTVKICDFGFSKSFRRGEGAGHRTDMLTILGTKGYMSPEMLTKIPYSEKTDIFSAGVILFILLAGYPPLQTAEIGDWWFERLLEGRYNRFWQAHAQGGMRCSNEAKNLIVNMLEPNPRERYTIDQVLSHDWMRGAVYDKHEHKRIMATLKANVDQRRAAERSAAMTRDTELDAIKIFVDEQEKKGWKPTLRRLVENKYSHMLRSVTSESDFMTTLNTIENAINAPGELRTQLLIEDPVQAATMLATSSDVSELQEVVNVDEKVASRILTLLQPLTRTPVDGHILGMEGRVHPKFFDFENTTLPPYDPQTTTLPLNSYRLKCGFDILCFALRYVTKKKIGGRMNPFEDGLVQLQFQLSKENNLPRLEAEDLEMTEAELSRRKALGLPLDAKKNLGGAVQTMSYMFNLEIQCFQDPTYEHGMIITIDRCETLYHNVEDMRKIVDIIMHETVLDAFCVPLPAAEGF